jgi:hypothetical protein
MVTAGLRDSLLPGGLGTVGNVADRERASCTRAELAR